MKRGRKQDDTLPPSRSREIQRAFRQRRSDYIRGLELRVVQLEAEVDEILTRHGETLRYTTAEVVAARSASRKKQKNKSKHNLAQFMDVNQLGEPATPHSPSFLAAASDNFLGVAFSPSITSSHDIRTDLSCATGYLMREMNGDFSSGQSSPQYSKASSSLPEHPGQDEYDSRVNISSSILSRRSKPLLQLWNAPIKTNDSRLSSHASNPPTSSQVSLPTSFNQYDNSSSRMDLFMDMDPVLPSSDLSSQLISSLALRPVIRVAPPSCPLPPPLADPFPPNDPLPSAPFSSHHSNPDVNSPLYNYRSSHSQLTERLNSYSYTFLDSTTTPTSSVSGYYQENSLSLLRSRSYRGQPQEPDCGYQASTSQLSIAEPSISLDSLESLEALQKENANFVKDDQAKSASTVTPRSTTPSEPKDLDPQIHYEPHFHIDDQNLFDDFNVNHNACMPFYHQTATQISRDKNMTQFAAEMYQM